MKTTGWWCYTITTPDNMVYVGVSQGKKTENRWQPSCYKTTSLQPYIEKYGWENLKHEIVKQCMTKQEAFDLENELIERYGEEGRKINKVGSGGWTLDKEKKMKYDRDLKRKWNTEHTEEHRERSRLYYEEHKNDVDFKNKRRKYREEHSAEWKEYHREYMRQYRSKKKY